MNEVARDHQGTQLILTRPEEFREENRSVPVIVTGDCISDPEARLPAHTDVCAALHPDDDSTTNDLDPDTLHGRRGSIRYIIVRCHAPLISAADIPHDVRRRPPSDHWPSSSSNTTDTEPQPQLC